MLYYFSCYDQIMCLESGPLVFELGVIQIKRVVVVYDGLRAKPIRKSQRVDHQIWKAVVNHRCEEMWPYVEQSKLLAASVQERGYQLIQ